ncbi:hypothetical protein M407DRAFT_5082 [Tulasnella calospora MUT 4182]|uniref:Uncharacterized protein n=1 Tax=Tulasnella calospora MUT 4182 TaxID=1051891 RepID=A0A0C3QHT0_9AGAM|nr:hypothetical protein M407DRAFT_5082 [Tulasnella calospora MUT 4182]
MSLQKSHSLQRLNEITLTTEEKANKQLERRRHLTIESPISMIDVPAMSTNKSQVQSVGSSPSDQETSNLLIKPPTEAMLYLSKALESLRDALKLLEKHSDTGLYSKNMRPATSEDILPQVINTLWPRKEQDVTRGTVDQHMAKIIDFAQVIRTASDFALVGHIACKAASKQVLLASQHGHNTDSSITLNIKRELKRIYASSANLIHTAGFLRRSIGQLRVDARKIRNEIARCHSDAGATTVALARASDIQKFLLAFTAFPFLLILASFVVGNTEGPQSTAYISTAGLGSFMSMIQTFIGQRTSGIKKEDADYVKKAFEQLNQLVISLEKLEGVVSGYEAVLTEMRMLLTSDFFEGDVLQPSTAVVWQFIEDKFKVLNEQGGKAREFLDHHRMSSVDAPHLIDLTSEAISAAALGL